MNEPEPPVGAFTGLPLDLPVGKHPFDNYLRALVLILGRGTAARYLGLDPNTGEPLSSSPSQ